MVDITLTIPNDLTKDFLGIMALDVLHDAKGYGYLVGHKLSQLTDLLSEAIFFHEAELLNDLELNTHTIQNYVFKKVLEYFLELWEDNIKALGLSALPDTSTKIDALREIVLLPIRTVADRDNEDTFASLGKNKHGIEAQNYYDQRNKLTREHAETMAFISPKGIKRPADYFRQASGIVDIIRHRTSGRSKVVLDMKSAAGLIRTLTDPLGYTTGLPTYADPGYNMPGMSAIRQYADIAFIDDQRDGYYTGAHEFRYNVQLETPFCNEALKILDVTYFYGVAKDGLDRSNVLISVLDETYNNMLPRSMMMAESLGKYLNPVAQEYTLSIADTFSTVKEIIYRYYEDICPQTLYTQSLQAVYSQLHQQIVLEPNVFACLHKSGAFLYEWCMKENMIFRVSYILATLQNLQYFDISTCLPKDPKCLLPEQMITTTLPELMHDYLNCKQELVLAFCHHQLCLLGQYIGQDGVDGVPYQAELAEMLSKQWIPKRKGKLVTQIQRQVLEWHKTQAAQLSTVQNYITTYIQDITTTCQQNLQAIVDLDYNSNILQLLPQFKPSILLEQILNSYLHFYNPELYFRTTGVVRTGLLMATMLDIILSPKPLLQLDLNLQTPLTTLVDPTADEYRHDSNAYDALRAVIGKFSGDFGQIMWCICYGHIFASEDNNTSAMALMLHRLPKKYINACTNFTWGNIHGLGDGSCVDVTIDK